MELIQWSRPPVCTGCTEDGWLTWRPGDVTIRVYRAGDGRMVYETENHATS